jgi:hypothetical protein
VNGIKRFPLAGLVLLPKIPRYRRRTVGNI